MTGIRRLAVGLLLVMLIAPLVRSDAPAPPALVPPSAAQPDLRPLAVVSLGDSTLAGEGAGDYLPGTRGENGNFCHRSVHAEVRQITLPGVSRRINLACSGTGSVNIGFDAPEDAAAAQGSYSAGAGVVAEAGVVRLGVSP